MPYNDMRGPLHRHPRMEHQYGLDDDHVIVDKREWTQVRSLLNAMRGQLIAGPITVKLNELGLGAVKVEGLPSDEDTE